METGSSFKDLWERWMIGTDGERERERESGKSVLLSQLDDDDNDDKILIWILKS